MIRLLYRNRVAHAVALVAGVFLVYYVWWRATQTLNPDAWLFSLLLFAAELHGIVSFYLFAFMVWDVDCRPPFRLRPGLTVDVFVPTYNESVEILEATLTGCNAITYPHTTYLLDDGRRPEVARLAAELGVEYLTRPDNRHAKAGNLNAALARTSGEFIVVLDADTVPQPDLLEKTLGYFVDPKVAFVQLPQEFYNQDSVQHADDSLEESAWHEQALFYRLIQPGKNRWNAAFWCGSPSVVRRAALEDVGGVATDTITEDIHTSVRLHARGWKSVYHNETLAYGIAPQTFQAFAVQRLRWAQGTMQLLRTPDNPLVKPGLTLAQRLNYLASMMTYFDSYQKLIYLLAPSIVLFTGILPLNVPGVEFLINWIPYFVLTALANIALGRGQFRFLLVEQYNLLKLFVFLWATTILFWPRKISFQVTPKNVDTSVTETERLLLRPQVAVLAVIGVSVVLGIVNLMWGVTASYSRPDIVIATVVWALANAGLLVLGVRAVLRRLHARTTYRFPVRVPIGLTDVAGRIVPGTAIDLSPAGAGVRLDEPAQLGKSVTAIVELPSGLIGARGEVRYVVRQPDGSLKAGVRFIALDPADRERLVFFLFVAVPRSLSIQPPALEPAARVA
ncbi:MAG: UDP-glucose-beta-D-glucan glucosyltransferase [Dehalococcoidia bacterium]|nr:MAG: UDP-glucose-beta-D-glucan glucosyltransferase [Dehalococcoidia bacterium]